jgi:hypothetical protein
MAPLIFPENHLQMFPGVAGVVLIRLAAGVGVELPVVVVGLPHAGGEVSYSSSFYAPRSPLSNILEK